MHVMQEAHAALFDSAVVRREVAKWAIDCGGRVQARRKVLGLTRAELAALVGSTEPSILRIEAGSLNPRDHLRWAISESLCVPVCDLWVSPGRDVVAALKGEAA